MAISHMEVPMKIHQPASAIEDASQGARRATEEASSIAPPPDPEVAATAKRRQFSSSERRRILAAADRCSKTGEIGALLRREGIYSSQLATWRKQREATERAGLEPKKRGRKAANRCPDQPTKTGHRHHEKTQSLDTKLMQPGVSKSLTRSEPAKNA